LNIFLKAIIFPGLILGINIAYASENSEKPEVLWTAVFSNVMPLNSGISQAYCDQHTPTVMVTTIDQITSKNGVKALNGVTVRYLSYKTLEKDHLYFNIVNATISGNDKTGKPWFTPMRLYEQTLNLVDVTYTTWSTPYCKGTFLGTPTKLS
jgi:hypothetical protein